MTAIKPIENRRVRGVPSERYPLNATTSHPENDAPATEAHHCFPRSQQIGDSWFVEISFDTVAEAKEALGEDADLYRRESPKGPLTRPKVAFKGAVVSIIPHVTGLTAGEHKDIEEHRAKIALEAGVWVWYEHNKDWDDPEHPKGLMDEWQFVGPLNPQPGSREGKPKKKRRKAAEGEVLKQRPTWQVRVPADVLEDGANLMDEDIEVLRDLLIALDAPGPITAETSTYYIIKPGLTWAIAAMGLELKARKAAEKEERARKRAAKASS